MMKASERSHVTKTLIRALRDTIVHQPYILGRGADFDRNLGQMFERHFKQDAPHRAGYLCQDGKRRLFRLVTGETYKKEFKGAADVLGKLATGRDGQVDLRALIGKHGPAADLVIISQPNGSQRFPDYLIVAGGIGLAIESKSTKTDHVVWNGGLPRQGALYIFNCQKGFHKTDRGTTVFVGASVISEEYADALLEYHEENQKLAKRFRSKLDKIAQRSGNELERSGLGFYYYVRAMYESRATFFEDLVLRGRREREVWKFLRTQAFKG